MNQFISLQEVRYNPETKRYEASIIFQNEREGFQHQFSGEGPSINDALTNMLVDIKMSFDILKRVDAGLLNEIAVSQKKALNRFMGIE